MNEQALEVWLTRYGAAWEARDPEAAAALFSADAAYRDTPYSEPYRGRDGVRQYWSTVTADQREVGFSHQTLGFVDGTGVATWSAKFKLASSGASVELNGVFLLRFSDAGECTSLREWWHAR